MAYTSRLLSFDSDVLNAFRGIIASGDIYTYWGIPLTSSPKPWKHSIADRASFLFAGGLMWNGRNVPPKGEKLRRRGGFPTWSWTSLVDQITMCPPPQGRERVVDATFPRFYVQDGSKLTPIRELLERALESSCLAIPEHGPSIVVEGRIAEVYLIPTDSALYYEVYAHALLMESSLRKVHGGARIDGDDPDVLSRIDHQPWQAVELMPYDEFRTWMLIDIHGQSARRIGMFMQEPAIEDGVSITLDLPTRDMTIRIE